MTDIDIDWAKVHLIARVLHDHILSGVTAEDKSIVAHALAKLTVGELEAFLRSLRGLVL